MAPTLREGSPGDSRAVFEVFARSVSELGQRLNTPTIIDGDNPEVQQKVWRIQRPMWEHLAQTSRHFWIAENAGKVIGYARSIERDVMLELTEFFILPGQQSAGLGQRLLERAFPDDYPGKRAIIATLDLRALSRYLKAGLYPRFPIKLFTREPEPVEYKTDLEAEALSASDGDLAILDQIDRQVLGYPRSVDHSFFMQSAQCFVHRRRGQPVGYAYVGRASGPCAVLEQTDLPAVLAHAEREAHAGGFGFELEVSLSNQVAVDYLLGRGFRMDPFVAFFMSNQPFGDFDRYIFRAPLFFI